MNLTAFARLSVVAAVFLTLLANAAFAADAWPGFRGPRDNGIAESTTAPITWDRKTNIAWRTELPGQGWSSPVIGEGVIYVSAAIPRSDDPTSDYDLALILVSVDSGEVIRVSNLIAQEGQSAAAIHKKNQPRQPDAADRWRSRLCPLRTSGDGLHRPQRRCDLDRSRAFVSAGSW